MTHFLSKAALGACALLLSGCFVAENDAANPIIPDASLAYPLKVGAAKECSESADGQQCKRAQITRLPAGGYEFRTWDADAGPDDEPTTDTIRMRGLQGKGIPNDTYLVQQIQSLSDDGVLGLLVRRPDGAWVKVSPQCENLRPANFVAFMNDHWIQTGSEQLSSMKCEIRRDGLTDERLYQILDAPKKSSEPTLIFDGA